MYDAPVKPKADQGKDQGLVYDVSNIRSKSHVVLTIADECI